MTQFLMKSPDLINCSQSMIKNENNAIAENVKGISETANGQFCEAAQNAFADAGYNVKLRGEIAMPELASVEFSANSIEETVEALVRMEIDSDGENVAIIPMNTKLSFIGASIFGLMDRNARLVYAVPEAYNPLYCQGAGELKEFNITDYLKSAQTIAVSEAQS